MAKGRFRKFAKKAYAFGKKAYGQRNAIAKVASEVWRLKKVLNVEKKYLDYISPAQQAFAKAGTVVAVPYPATGTSTNQRTGNSIKIASLAIRFSATRETAVQTFANIHKVRIMLVLDKTPIVGSLTLADVLEDSTSPGNIVSLLNYETFRAGRFAVLMDKTYSLTNQNPQFTWKKYFRLNHHAKFNGTTGTAVSDNRMYMFVIPDADSVATDSAYLTSMRIQFIDN